MCEIWHNYNEFSFCCCCCANLACLLHVGAARETALQCSFLGKWQQQFRATQLWQRHPPKRRVSTAKLLVATSWILAVGPRPRLRLQLPLPLAVASATWLQLNLACAEVKSRVAFLRKTPRNGNAKSRTHAEPFNQAELRSLRR